MEWFLLYLLAITFKLNVALMLACIGFAFGATLLKANNHKTEWVKRGFTCSLICLAIWAFIPPQKDFALIIAGAAAYKVLTTPEAQELGGKGLKLLNQKLDKYLDEDEKPTTHKP